MAAACSLSGHIGVRGWAGTAISTCIIMYLHCEYDCIDILVYSLRLSLHRIICISIVVLFYFV